jgi:hypothetical protein
LNIFNLFPTALGLYDLDRDFTEKEMKFIKGQETRSNMGNTTSVDNNLLDRKELKDLRKFVDDALAEYFKAVYAPKLKTKLRITQSGATTPNRVSSITNTPTPIRLSLAFCTHRPIKRQTRFTSTKTDGNNSRPRPRNLILTTRTLGGWKPTRVGCLYSHPT